MYTHTNILFIITPYYTSILTQANIKEKWMGELGEHAKGIPFVLVGTKTDLRDDENTQRELAERDQTTVTRTQGAELAEEIKAVAYVECSAMEGSGLKEVFHGAVRAALANREKKKGKCAIL